MRRDSHTDEQIRVMLQDARRVAVVGMSRSTTKAAGHVPRYLIKHGYDILPVNPYTKHIDGIPSYNVVSDIEGRVDIVDVFRPSEQVASIIHEALDIKPGAIWLQEGLYSREAEQMAQQAGIPFVYNRCIMMEYMKLVGA